MPRPLFIVNPNAGGGAAGRRWPREILPRVIARFPDARWVLTRAPGQAAALADRARQQGAGLVMAVGGDGTVHEIVNGLMGELLGQAGVPLPVIEGAPWGPAEGREDPAVTVRGSDPAATARAEEAGLPTPALGVLPIGTGCDLVKTLGIPRDIDRALDILAAGLAVPADVCEIAATSNAGAPMRRFSINICGCGVSGEVASEVNRARWPRHGLLAFLLATLRGVARYRPRAVTIAVDDRPPRAARLLALFVCNGEYCGGGMRPGRGARIDDGVVKVVEVGAMPLRRILVKLPRLYSGRVEGVAGVLVHHARRVEVAGEHALVDCDGEQPARLPVTFTARPAALRVIVADPRR